MFHDNDFFNLLCRHPIKEKYYLYNFVVVPYCTINNKHKILFLFCKNILLKDNINKSLYVYDVKYEALLYRKETYGFAYAHSAPRWLKRMTFDCNYKHFLNTFYEYNDMNTTQKKKSF